MCAPLLWMEEFPSWKALSDGHWVVKLHKCLILEMQVWGGSKIAYRQDCQQFSAIYPKFLLSCSELLHSEGRQEWSNPLGRSKSLWEVHQVHLQARLHNLSLKNREKKDASYLFWLCTERFSSSLTSENGNILKWRFKNFLCLSEFYTPSAILSSSASFILKFSLLHLPQVGNNCLECSENKRKSWKEYRWQGNCCLKIVPLQKTTKAKILKNAKIAYKGAGLYYSPFIFHVENMKTFPLNQFKPSSSESHSWQEVLKLFPCSF